MRIDISRKIDIMESMEPVDVFKALANESRIRMLKWLGDPERYFPSDPSAPDAHSRKFGVCVGLLQKKSGLSQSTVSHYLALLQKAGLVIASRQGQWTYYKRNEKALKAVARFLKEEI